MIVRGALVAAGSVLAWITIAAVLFVDPSARAEAAPRAVEDKTPPPEEKSAKPSRDQIPKSLPELRLPGEGPASEPSPSAADVYRALLKSAAGRSAADTMGNGLFALAKGAFYAGDFDQAAVRSQEFTRIYTRNLNMNDALEIVLLCRNFRDFESQPLRAYARTLAHRETGSPDSAATLANAALERWPGAKVRYHFRYQLAELARDRGDHASAVTQALVVADSSSASRLAPAALKLAGDETMAMGQGPDRALRFYQQLLERFPESPLAPGIRAQVLEMRKRHQL